jgi:competence ComEA-like helix-hairpin-helix protein
MDFQPEQLNLNQADVEQLAQLPGIGPALAERIVDQRQNTGPFADIQDLTAVHGISEAMVEDIAGFLTVSDVETAESPEELSIEQDPPNDGRELDDDEAMAALAEEIRFVTEDESMTSPEPVLIVPEEIGEVNGIQEDLTEEEARPESLEADLSGERPASKYDEADPLRTQPAARPVVEEPVAGIQTQPRGCSFQAAIFGTIFGALMGVFLTLIILFFLNGGTLQFASERESGRSEEQIQTQMETLKAEQGDKMEQVEQLDTLVNQMIEDVSVIATQQSELMTSIEETGDVVSGFETKVATMEERIAGIFIAADDFNTFIDGLRQLMLQIEETKEVTTTTPAAGSTGTPGQGSPTAEPEATQLPTPTPRPATRTPRPTFTPIVTAPVSPANTPAATVTP